MTCYQNRGYPTDLSHEQWAISEPLLPSSGSRGRPRPLDLRQVINAILYGVVGGIQWRLLPHDFPPRQSVYYYFCTWRDSGQWQRIHDRRRAQVRRCDNTGGFKVLPRRRVVERTFGRLVANRRLAKDHEAPPTSSETMIHIAMIRLTVRRLAR